MKERGTLFSAPMVRGILAGTKTQARRVVKTRVPLSFLGGKGTEHDPSSIGYPFDGPGQHGWMVLGRGHNSREDHGLVSIPCPYGVPGDRLILLSSWATEQRYDVVRPKLLPADARIWSRWDGTEKPEWAGKLRPGRFLPREMRYLMPRAEITEIRVQRLQDISAEDAIAEGMTKRGVWWDAGPNWEGDGADTTAVGAFCQLWYQINGPGSWDLNPWVWCISFRRIKGGAND